jgi:hypothetical protein
MKQIAEVLHWVLGILAVLSLILGVIFKLIGVYNIYTATPLSFLRLASICCLGSMALSLRELVHK